jgi:hypothetical protein
MSEEIDFTSHGGWSTRTEGWSLDGVAELELAVDVGRITVHLDEAGTGQVHVDVRDDPSIGGMFTQGISGVMNWLGQATGGPTASPADLAAEAVAACTIDWSESGRRLVVRSSQEIPLRVVPLAVTVTAPAGSRLAARTGAGDVHVTGTAGWTAVRTGAGHAEIETIDGDADVTTGSGDVDLGAVAGRSRVRTASGRIRVARAGGTAELKTGSGDVTVGAVHADLTVRTGSGSVTVGDGTSGRIDLTAGSGDLSVGVHAGVLAEVDLSSGSGTARCDLPVQADAPGGTAGLQVRGRTGSGDVEVRRA